MSFLSKGFLIGGCMVFGYAVANESATPLLFAPTPAGASIYGMGGNGWTAIGDLMAPVFGQPLNFTYLDPQVYFHSPNQASGSLGLGQRWLTSNAGILSAYVFGDYNYSANNNSFWFISPGIERLGETFDFSANAYIPVSNQRSNTGQEFADQAGEFNYVQFSGHTEYDELVNTYESTGWGADAQIGMRIPLRNGKIYVGGYYFNPKDSDSITGGLVRLDVPINDIISATASEAYDSQYHNTFKAGLTFSLGGRNTGYHFTGNLAERIVDPIQRNAIAVAGGAANAQPVVDNVEDTGQIAVEMTNISFFVPGVSPTPDDETSTVTGDGSYENPYQGMTQDNVDNANTQNNRNFFINSGVYSAVYDPTVNPDFIVLNNDQLYGRQNNFTEWASDGNRPIINFAAGGFLVPGGDSNDSFTGLQLFGNDLQGSAGIFIDHESGGAVGVNINSSTVSHFGDGIDIYNSIDSNVVVAINDSFINNNFSGGVDQLRLAGFGGYSGGVAALNEGAGVVNLNINQSTISNNGNNAGVANWGAIGAFNNGLGSLGLTVNNSTINNNNIGTAIFGAGILVDNEGTGLLTASINKTSLANDVDGLQAVAGFYNTVNNTLNLTVKNSTIDDNSANGIAIQSGEAFGINDVNAQILNSKITNNLLAGVLLETSGPGDTILNINKSWLDSNGTDGLLVLNSNDFGEETVTVSNSELNNNDEDGIFTENRGNEGNMTLNVANSKISGNSNDGIDFDTSSNFGLTNLIVNNTVITNNVVNGINVGTSSSPGATVVDIDQAFITGNNVGINISNKNSANKGGPNNVTVNIDHSNISNNNTGISVSSETSATDIGVSASNVTVNINNSLIGWNQIGISANSASQTNLGLDSGNSTSNLILNVNNAKIIGNGTGIMADSNASVIDGAGSSSATTTINIEDSSIVGNGVGVSATSVNTATGVSTTEVNIDQSIVAGNSTALEATGSGVTTIAVTNPVFFSGMVEYTGNGIINFPSPVNTPNSGDYVVCTPASGCFIAAP